MEPTLSPMTPPPTPIPTPVVPVTPPTVQTPSVATSQIPTQPNTPKSEKNTPAAQFAYIMKNHKKGFLITIISVVAFTALFAIPTRSVTSIITALFFIFIAFAIWFGIARQQLERKLFGDFAAQHGYTFIAKPAPFPLPIPVEGLGHSHRSFDYLTGNYPGAVQFSMFTHQFTVGSGKNSETFTFCVTSLVLPGVAPHLYLAAPTVPSIVQGAIEASFQSVKKYSLEGDFDKHYTLYGAANDEVDLLEVMNPASMEKLMQVSGYSILLNGNVLTYLIRSEPLSTDDLTRTLAAGQYFLAAFAHTIKEMSAAATLEATQAQS